VAPKPPRETLPWDEVENAAREWDDEDDVQPREPHIELYMYDGP
jgi:hypothetical protein